MITITNTTLQDIKQSNTGSNTFGLLLSEIEKNNNN